KELLKKFENFRNEFETEKIPLPLPYSGFFGYTSYNAVSIFDEISLKRNQGEIPEMIYSFYSLILIINHFNDELFIFSNAASEKEAEEKLQKLIRLLENKSIPSFAFRANEKETSDCTDEEYLEMVKKGKQHCKRGDVFQIVLSRRFKKEFTGDEFEVYRALRNVNPSPYLYYFDFGNFKLFGSSPEAQLVIKKGIAEIHPIAGTLKRTGEDEKDILLAEELKQNEKENAEHIMLVDLARNDLSRHCKKVKVEKLREIQFYSHVIHLVSKVTGELKAGADVYSVMKDSFPAGTLSGAPKHKAMQLISEYEHSSRGFYGGAVGFIGTDGSFNHAIVIRSFFSKENTLYYRAGAGVVNASDEQSELNEVNNKVGAMRKAIKSANQKFLCEN
ncbi:MAG: anthranilate synthase component I family protein, partial [Bacteroidia bacterium]|nr:anthranilate synthase component I family protein [Bacteroidia bacterium]